MPKTTFLATAPCGTVLKRTSENRTYTHCIAWRPSYQAALARAGKISGIDGTNWDFYKGVADGTERLSHAMPEPERANAVHLIKEFPTRDSYIAGKRDQRIAAVEALKRSGFYDRYQAATWCGRPDLAQKELHHAGRAAHGDSVSIPVTIKGA